VSSSITYPTIPLRSPAARIIRASVDQNPIDWVDPGYTATDLNEPRGVQPVEQGAEVIVAIAKLDGSGPTGTFVDQHGAVPW
jgi:hypothetical protein